MPTIDGVSYENEGFFADVELNNARLRLRTKLTGVGYVAELEDLSDGHTIMSEWVDSIEDGKRRATELLDIYRRRFVPDAQIPSPIAWRPTHP